MRLIPLVSLSCLLALGVPAPGYAVDGVLEINQTCAVQTGCFSGDDPGFPVTIVTPGSYRLTGNLTVPDENTGAIVVQASRSTVDLGGFGILGPNNCSANPPNFNVCTANGTGIGIDASAAALVEVRNGSVAGMGFHGVDLFSLGVASGLRVADNGGDGIRVGLSGRADGNLVLENFAFGISVGTAGRAAHNVGFRNGDAGISTAGGATVLRNTMSENRFGIIAMQQGNGKYCEIYLDDVSYTSGRDAVSSRPNKQGR